MFVTEGPEKTGIDRHPGRDDRQAVLPSWEGHDSDVNDVQFSPDGSMLATAGEDGVLKSGIPATGDLRSSVREGAQVSGSRSAPTGRSWRPRGRTRRRSGSPSPSTGQGRAHRSGGSRSRSRRRSVPTGSSVAVARRLACRVPCSTCRIGSRGSSSWTHLPVDTIAWDPDGRRIATGAFDSSVRIWDGRTGRLEIELLGQSGTVHSVDWSPDESRLVSAGSDGAAQGLGDRRGRRPRADVLSGQDTRRASSRCSPRTARSLIGGNAGSRREDLGRRRSGRRRGGQRAHRPAGARGRRVPA